MFEEAERERLVADRKLNSRHAWFDEDDFPVRRGPLELDKAGETKVNTSTPAQEYPF